MRGIRRKFEDEETQERDRRRIYSNQNTNILSYDDAYESKKIFLLSPEERKYILQNTYNPLGYPKSYYELYRQEMNMREPQGYNGCVNITNQPLFIAQSDQQFRSTIRIKQSLNPNCIKSKEEAEEFDPNTKYLHLNKNTTKLVYENLGIKIIPSEEKVLEQEIQNIH